MSFSRQQIVITARAYLGAPWLHQGRTPAGLDCVGLLYCAARDAGCPLEDITEYSRDSNGIIFQSALMAQLEQLPGIGDAQPGDVLAMRYGRAMWHCLIVTERRGDAIWAVHAVTDDRVAEHRLDALWMRRVHSAWRLKGGME